MKKWVIGAVVFLLVVISIIYASIPSRIDIINITYVKSNVNAVQRTISRKELWNKWFPAEFSVTRQLTNGIDLEVKSGNNTVPGELIVFPIRNDSSAITWKASLPLTSSPVAKISGYLMARQVKSKVYGAMKKFRDFCSNDSNVYGLTIRQISTKDTFLIATKFFTSTEPSIENIYENINRLRKFVVENDLAETNAPMLNVTRTDSGIYRGMVAVPINRMVQGKGDISFIRMIPGQFLKTEVTGGPAAIRHAHRVMAQYFTDYNRVSMAIPFEYLTTDRLLQKDTAGWKTILYYPVY